jgi:hypothetical protein
MSSTLAFDRAGRRNGWIVARIAGLAVAVAAIANLGACDGNDQVADAISRANIKLTGMVPGGSATAAPSVDTKNYQELITNLKAVSGKGGAGQQAAVELLTARAQLGLAGQATAEAAEAERASLTSITAVRSALHEYLTYSGQVAALSTFDPSPLLAELDAQIGQREADLAKARKAKQDIDGRLAALAATAQGKMDQAAAERKIEADLRQQAMRVSDTEAAELITQANVHRRLADGFDVEASTLEAQSAQIAPEAPEAQLRIDQLTGQRDQLGRGRDEIKKRSDENRQLITAARADQAKAAEAVDTAIKALSTAREGDLPTRYKAAVARLGEATDSANRAAKTSKGPSQLAVAEAKHALGDLRWAEAQGLAIAAETLEAAAGASGLPGQAEYAQQAATARESQKAALDAATEAYQAAKSGYEGGNTKGEAATRLEDVNAKLIQIIMKTSGGAVDLSAELTNNEEAPAAPAEAADSSPPSVSTADSPQTPVETLLRLTKAGEFDGLLDVMYVPDQNTRDLLVATMGMLGKMKQLDDACKAKFGNGLSDDPNSMMGQQQAMLGVTPEMESLSAADLSYSVTGDTATASHASLPEPLRLRKVDGRWLIDGTTPTGVDAQSMQAAAKMIPIMNKAVDTLIADVQAGKYKTTDEVSMALMAEMMKAVGPGGG